MEKTLLPHREIESPWLPRSGPVMPPRDAEAEAPDRGQRLDAVMLVRAAQRQASKGYGIMLATALVVMAQSRTPGAVWLPWFVGLRVAVMLFNLWINQRIRALAAAGAKPAELLAWEPRFAFGQALSGACWGMVGWMMPTLDHALWSGRDMLCGMLLIYLSSMVLITTAHAPRALTAHVTAMWLVSIVTCLSQPEPLREGLIIVVAVVCLLITSLLFGRILVRQTRSGVQAELERQDLTESLRHANEELEKTLRQAVRAASRDPLTGVLNRRALYAHADYIAATRRREPSPCAVMLLDLDHFKRINDRHGHAAGDAVLAAVARALTGALRESDVVARWGGEEFLVLLPDCGPEAAHARAEGLRRDVAALEVDELPRGQIVSVSIGVVEWPLEGALDDAIKRADDALYRAKAAGRDCIFVAA